jgi:hypothetical protein
MRAQSHPRSRSRGRISQAIRGEWWRPKTPAHGVDLLDFSFRIEKGFGIKIDREDFRALEPSWMSRNPTDVTAGEMPDWVVSLCEAQGMQVPHSNWDRVRLELAKVVGKPPQIIHRETLVKRELGFC